MAHALIEAHRLAAVTPDAISLFNDLDLVLERGVVALVGRNGSGKSTLGRILAGLREPDAGSVRRHGTIGWLPQEFRPDPQARVIDVLGVARPWSALQRIKTGEALPRDLDAVGDRWELTAQLGAWLARFGLEHLTLTAQVRACSGGELTRMRLIALLLNKPQFLILDEPSNHLDAAGRQQLIRFLGEWQGGALVITHDRALLEQATRIFELSSVGLTVYPGPWAAYRASKAQELAAAEHQYAVARSEHREQKARRQTALERQQRRQNRARKDRREANQAKLLLYFMEQGCEATGARLRRQHAARVAEAQEREHAARTALELAAPIALAIPAARSVAGKRILGVRDLSMRFGERALYERLGFELLGTERLRVRGANGCGKSVLLRLVCGALQPTAGEIVLSGSWRVLDQHQSLLDDHASSLDNFGRLATGLSEAEYRTRLARLGMRGDHVLRPVAVLSGGERLKVALAAILLGPRPSELLLLDEPTNHQDLESVEALERALRDFQGAMIIVSHDDHFVSHVGCTHELDLDQPRPHKRPKTAAAAGDV